MEMTSSFSENLFTYFRQGAQKSKSLSKFIRAVKIAAAMGNFFSFCQRLRLSAFTHPLKAILVPSHEVNRIGMMF